MPSAKAISHIGAMSGIVIILGIAAVGIYFGYSLSGHSVTQTNKLTLQAFSLNPSTANLTGTVYVDSNSPLVRMALYMNDTYMGSFDYAASMPRNDDVHNHGELSVHVFDDVLSISRGDADDGKHFGDAGPNLRGDDDGNFRGW